MDQGIGGVLELLGHHRIGIGFEDLLGPHHRPAHALFRRRQLEPCAQQGQHLAPFHRHALGHDQDQRIALGRADEGQRDAGVAAGRLHDGGLAGDDAPFHFQSLDHRGPDAVLHAGDRIEELQLGHDLALGLQLGREPWQPHQRGVANGVDDRVVDPAPPGAAIALGVIGGGWGRGVHVGYSQRRWRGRLRL